MSAAKLRPIHPGEILAEEFLGPLGISLYPHPRLVGTGFYQLALLIRNLFV